MTSLAALRQNTHKGVILLISAILLVYAIATALGWTDALAGAVHTRDAAGGGVHVWAVIPFGLLLAAIALLPLIEHTAHWWENNLHKFYVAVILGLITLMYIAALQPGGGLGRALHTLQHVVVKDYIPFIVLLFSLYTISGGIRIHGDLRAHPLTNTAFMAAGGLLASFMGTTGAAMLLIRPLLETNAQRKHVRHTLVFFIYVVCNCGGLLLPLGDPPLFLGYLNGVDFFWTLTLWKSWLLVNGLLLAVYFLLDHFYYYRREAPLDVAKDETRVTRLSFAGVWPNSLLLVGIVAAVALLDPSKAIAGWQPWFYFREMTMLALVALSLLFGPPAARDDNQFDYLAIVEVGALFIGIFVAMQPALEMLEVRGGSLGIDTPLEFFWATGWLSSMLDNAPTYLVFFETGKALSADAPDAVAGVAEPLLRGIALGSVTMGAMTYIGNGPNFMVKSIAEKAGVPMPSFFGYLGYSIVILLPILALNAWLFVR